MKITEVVAAMIRDGEKFMICQRPETKARALKWEFPGGKIEPGETPEQALARECFEELAIGVSVGAALAQTTHEYPDLTIRLTLYECRIESGTPVLKEHRAAEWITATQITDYELCEADQEFLNVIFREQ